MYFMSSAVLKFDVCIIGSGLSGLTVALNLPQHLKICILTHSSPGMNASSYAQGGVAAVTSADDSADIHAHDTVLSGAGLGIESVIKDFTNNSKKAIDWLNSQGVSFRRNDDGSYSRAKEGGHSRNRILHSSDETGKNIMANLQKNVNKAKNITILSGSSAIDFILAENAITGLIYYSHEYCITRVLQANNFVLATGGASGIYLNSTNPESPCGDGMAMAWRAGCRLANLEFNQFHPTCMSNNSDHPLLISEAVRGEGAILCHEDGQRFMPKYHPLSELATRDIVARAIYAEMKDSGSDCVFLDITHKPAKWLKNRFPAIYRGCLSYGINIAKDRIPVSPASHYSCGGIVVNSSARTDIPNLYAVGEVAYTGFHGANRLASNSLLECVLTAIRAAEDINQSKQDVRKDIVMPKLESFVLADTFMPIKQVKKLMWDHVGLVRTTDGLKFAKESLIALQQDYASYGAEFYALKNMILMARLTVESALSRKESRGGHYNLDYPKIDRNYDLKPTFVQKSMKHEVIA